MERAIDAAGHYDGPIDQYYRNALAVSLQDGATRQLLGLLCRAAPTIPVAWLKEWPEGVHVEDVLERVLAPFTRVEDGRLHFINDSLIAFLTTETRSKLPDQDALADERRFHFILADRCGERPCKEPLGRARVFHLLRAERKTEILDVLSSQWLREGMEAFLPYAVIRPLLLSGLDAAWTTGAVGHVLRLILLDHEFDQRTSRTEAGSLAEKLLELDEPELAVSQIRAGGRLLVDDPVVLEFASSLWQYARWKNQPELEKTARALYLQAKPVSLMYQSEPIDLGRDHDASSKLGAWSEAAPFFEELTDIVAGVNRLRFTGSEYGQDVDSGAVQAGLLYDGLLTSIEIRAGASHRRVLLDALTALGQPTWRFAALLRIAEAFPAEMSHRNLVAAHAEAARDDDLDLVYGVFLYSQGYADEARKLVGRLPHIRFDIHRESHSFGLSDITYTVALRRLQDLLGLPEGPVPGVTHDREEVYARIETTARRIGALLASVERGKPEPELHATMRSLLLFHNRAVTLDSYDWRNQYPLTQSRQGIEAQIMRLAAAIGRKGVRALRDALADLVEGPAGEQFTGPCRRRFALMLYDNGAMSREDAVRFGLSSTAGIDDQDPAQRQEACLEIATFLHSIGDHIQAKLWLARASDVSAGAGSHKDYHMAPLAEWLGRCVESGSSDDDCLRLFDKFARSVEVAGGAGQSDAAEHLLALVLGRYPLRASWFATELVDRSVLDLSQTLKALVVGGAQANAPGDLLLSMYCELHSLVDPTDTSAAAVATLRRCGPDRREIAAAIIASVRTNALPSRRVEIARSLQDALLEDGFGPVSLVDGPQGGHDDSSRRTTLYRLANGESLTVRQVADWLSDELPSNWNPNPTDNGEFDWWAAIKKTRIRDRSHLEALLSTFPSSEYRHVEVLAWKAQRLMELGEQATARDLAERALERAKDGTWHPWLDGAPKRVAYAALKCVGAPDALQRARAEFGRDLGAGRLNSSWLLAEIVAVFELLEVAWPVEATRTALVDYLDQVLRANQIRPSYVSLDVSPTRDLDSRISVEEALCRVLVQLLAFPVTDVGVGARRALARHVASGGSGLFDLVRREPCWDSVQLEHLLICIHVGALEGKVTPSTLQQVISGFNKHHSLAVRSIARRLCEHHGWPWKEIIDQPAPTVIFLGHAAPTGYEEIRTLVDADAARAFHLHHGVFVPLERGGVGAEELRAEFYRAFHEVNRDYLWRDDERLQRWVQGALARQWLRPGAIVGREAAMRVIGGRALSGEAPPGAEEAYDALRPVYDPAIELLQPAERPIELCGLDWRLGEDQGQKWLRGENAGDWSHYPETIGELHVIGERTWLIRPEWEWPREERYRGLFVGPRESGVTRDALESTMELTYALYLEGRGQDHDQTVVLNPGRHLVGPVYRWAAISSNFAGKLGWRPVTEIPFAWTDSAGNLMVKSMFWRDGWSALEPPRFEALGEGWLVVATPAAIASIRQAVGTAELHLWVERHSHGGKAFEGKWHLSREF